MSVPTVKATHGDTSYMFTLSESEFSVCVSLSLLLSLKKITHRSLVYLRDAHFEAPTVSIGFGRNMCIIFSTFLRFPLERVDHVFLGTSVYKKELQMHQNSLSLVWYQSRFRRSVPPHTLPLLRLSRANIRCLFPPPAHAAVCPGLGLLAHQDGSHVRLLAFSPRSNRGELSGVTNGGVVVDIDLEGGQICHSSNDNGRKDRTGKGETGYGELVATSEGAARGLSWARCSSCFADGAVDAASAASGGLMIGVGPDRQLNRGSGRDAQDQEQHAAVGVGDADKGSSDGDGGGCGGDGLRPRSRPSSASGEWGGERICHLAVACGSEVRLWKVSRVFCGAGMAGTARGVRDGNDGYRYSIVKVLPDWHRTTCDNDNDNDSGSKNAPSPVGNIRCLSFRPCSDGMSGSPVAAARGGAVPLTAWYDMGAAVLRSVPFFFSGAG